MLSSLDSEGAAARPRARRGADLSGDGPQSEGFDRAPSTSSSTAARSSAFAGLLGSGRTELARLVYGADRPDTGTVELRGNDRRHPHPGRRARAAHRILHENRRDEGIIGDLSVRENLILAVQAERGWARPLSRREQDDLVAKYMTALERPAGRSRPADQEPLRRQPAEGAARPLARHQARAPDPRRADPRHRRRREGRDPGAASPTSPGGASRSSSSPRSSRRSCGSAIGSSC